MEGTAGLSEARSRQHPLVEQSVLALPAESIDNDLSRCQHPRHVASSSPTLTAMERSWPCAYKRSWRREASMHGSMRGAFAEAPVGSRKSRPRSEEHTSELQSRG